MTKRNQLIYTLKDGVATSIENVESGLKCGCICPSCGEPLVVKKGTKRMHHFPTILATTVSMDMKRHST